MWLLVIILLLLAIWITQWVGSMLDFVERIAEATGLPVGIRAAVGEIEFWRELARQM